MLERFPRLIKAPAYEWVYHVLANLSVRMAHIEVLVDNRGVACGDVNSLKRAFINCPALKVFSNRNKTDWASLNFGARTKLDMSDVLLYANNLRLLDLTYMGMVDWMCIELLVNLEELRLRNCWIDSHGVVFNDWERLAMGIEKTRTKRLLLSGSEATQSGWFLSTLHSHGVCLVSLNLGNNTGDVPVLPPLPALETLILDHRITLPAATIPSMKWMKSLVILNMNCSQVTDEKCEIFSITLGQNDCMQSLQEVSLAQNPISNKGLVSLTKAFSSIQRINLWLTDINDEESGEIIMMFAFLTWVKLPNNHTICKSHIEGCVSRHIAVDVAIFD